MDIRKLLDIHKCNCGREDCQFFNPSEYECGRSYTLHNIKIMLNDIGKVKQHLTNLLNSQKE